jgi:predicted nuclease of predicted toxin-antitoxin system
MKLHFDHNLSPRLVRRLSDLYPGASRVALVDLDRAPDGAVWAYAQTNDFIIITTDADCSDAVVVRGFPPKVLWLRSGNRTTSDAEQTLRRGHAPIVAFANDPAIDVLELV